MLSNYFRLVVKVAKVVKAVKGKDLFLERAHQASVGFKIRVS